MTAVSLLLLRPSVPAGACLCCEPGCGRLGTWAARLPSHSHALHAPLPAGALALVTPWPAARRRHHRRRSSWRMAQATRPQRHGTASAACLPSFGRPLMSSCSGRSLSLSRARRRGDSGGRLQGASAIVAARRRRRRRHGCRLWRKKTQSGQCPAAPGLPQPAAGVHTSTAGAALAAGPAAATAAEAPAVCSLRIPSVCMPFVALHPPCMPRLSCRRILIRTNCNVQHASDLSSCCAGHVLRT